MGVEVNEPGVDALRYRQVSTPARQPAAAELAVVKVRYKAPTEDTSHLIERIVRNRTQPMTGNLGFASAVAEFGLLLRQSDYRGSANFASVIERARAFRGRDEEGYRAEFIRLADLASGLYKLEDPQHEISRR